MAQVGTYKYLWHVPLPEGMGDVNDGYARSLMCVSCVGPATNVAAGFICDVSADMTYVVEAWQTSHASDAIGYMDIVRKSSATFAGATMEFIAKRCTSGIGVSDAAVLTSTDWHMMLVGVGPMASAIS